MTTVCLSKNLHEKIGEEVIIRGWLYNKRSSGSIAFLEIRDGFGWVSAVASKNAVPESVWEAIEKLTQESSLTVKGLVKVHPKKADTYEIEVKDIEIIQLAKDYPIAKKEHGPDFLMDNRHLWLRSNQQ
jgi:asparaginyl-tRNA synthetase